MVQQIQVEEGWRTVTPFEMGRKGLRLSSRLEVRNQLLSPGSLRKALLPPLEERGKKSGAKRQSVKNEQRTTITEKYRHRPDPEILASLGLKEENIPRLRHAVQEATKVTEKMARFLASELRRTQNLPEALHKAEEKGYLVVASSSCLVTSQGVRSVTVRSRLEMAAHMLWTEESMLNKFQVSLCERPILSKKKILKTMRKHYKEERPEVSASIDTFQPNLSIVSSSRASASFSSSLKKTNPSLAIVLRQKLLESERHKNKLDAEVLRGARWVASHAPSSSKRVEALSKTWACQTLVHILERTRLQHIQRATHLWKRANAITTNLKLVRAFNILVWAQQAANIMKDRVYFLQAHGVKRWKLNTYRLRMEEQSSAALTIQTSFMRPSLARSKVDKIKSDFHCTRAAIKIQTLGRRILARAKARHRHYLRAVCKVQRAARKFLAVKYMAGARFSYMMSRAATRITRASRQWLERKPAIQEKHARRIERQTKKLYLAAVCIQSIARRWLTIRYLVQLRLKQRVAIVHLQRVCRGYGTREKLKKVREHRAASIIQDKAHTYLTRTRKKREKEQSSATRIQSCLRCSFVSKHKEKKHAALRIQSQARRQLALLVIAGLRFAEDFAQRSAAMAVLQVYGNLNAAAVCQQARIRGWLARDFVLQRRLILQFSSKLVLRAIESSLSLKGSLLKSWWDKLEACTTVTEAVVSACLQTTVFMTEATVRRSGFINEAAAQFISQQETERALSEKADRLKLEEEEERAIRLEETRKRNEVAARERDKKAAQQAVEDAILRLEQKTQIAIKLQPLYRSRQSRLKQERLGLSISNRRTAKHAKHRESAASRLQCFFRGIKAKRTLQERRQAQAEALASIRAAGADAALAAFHTQRKETARDVHNSLSLLLHPTEPNDTSADDEAISIQKRVRGVLVRTITLPRMHAALNALKVATSAITLAEKATTDAFENFNYVKSSKDASFSTRIQAIARGHYCRNSFNYKGRTSNECHMEKLDENESAGPPEITPATQPVEAHHQATIIPDAVDIEAPTVEQSIEARDQAITFPDAVNLQLPIIEQSMEASDEANATPAAINLQAPTTEHSLEAKDTASTIPDAANSQSTAVEPQIEAIFEPTTIPDVAQISQVTVKHDEDALANMSSEIVESQVASTENCIEKNAPVTSVIRPHTVIPQLSIPQQSDEAHGEELATLLAQVNAEAKEKAIREEDRFAAEQIKREAAEAALALAAEQAKKEAATALAAEKARKEMAEALAAEQAHRETAATLAAAEAKREAAEAASALVADKLALIEQRMAELQQRESKIESLEATMEQRLTAVEAKNKNETEIASRADEVLSRVENELTQRAGALDEQRKALEARIVSLDGASPQEDVVENVSNNQEWLAYFDDASQCTYYYNPITGETTWELPPGATSRRGDDIVHAESLEAAQSDAGTYYDDLDSPTQGEWLEYWDESAGARYWYNINTHEASWTPPYESIADGSNGNGPAVPELFIEKNRQEAPQGAEWTAMIDPVTGQESWIHDETGEVWDGSRNVY